MKNLKKDEDFNHIKQWLDPLLDKRGWSCEHFANLCGLSRAQIYFYRNDQDRPKESTMAKMCYILGVPFEQGLRQYVPKKVGKPRKKG